MVFTKNILLNTLAQYFGKTISLLTAIVVTYTLTRTLGVANYGQYIFLSTLIMLLSSLSDWGSAFVAIREASSHPARQGAIYSTTIIVRFLISLFFQIGLLFAGLLIPSLRLFYVPLLAASFLLPILSLKTSLQVIFQSQFQLWRLSVIDTLGSLIFMFFVLLFNHLPNFNQLVFVLVSSASFIGTILGLLISLSLLRFPFHFDLKFAKYLILQSLSMGALFTLFSIYNRLDIFILKNIQGDTAVGIYGFSYKVYENLILGAGFLANATFPLLSARNQDKKLFQQAFEKYFTALLVLSFIAATVLFISAPLIVKYLAGPDFTQAVTPLRILSLSLIGAFLGHSTGYSLVALNRQVDGLKIAFFSLLLNASLNFILIPRFSYNAAAVNTVLTELFAFAVGFWLLRDTVGKPNIISCFKSMNPKQLLKILKS